MKSKNFPVLATLFFLPASPSHAVKPLSSQECIIESMEAHSDPEQTKFESASLMNCARFRLIGKTR